MARVTIGMPVYNAERYIMEALQSLVGQTYSDFEIIICDNASTDETFNICHEFCKKHKNITVIKNEKNIGAAANFNLVASKAKSEYFKWASYDDICHRDLIKKCVEFLDKNKDVDLCYSVAGRIDENGSHLDDYQFDLNTMSDKRWERFSDLIVKRHNCHFVFGVFRTKELKNTCLILSHEGSDRILLGEIGLAGKMYEIPEVLFFRRDHPNVSMRIERQNRIAWFDPLKSGRMTYPNWRIMVEHARSIFLFPMAITEKLKCFRVLLHHIKVRFPYLVDDLKFALKFKIKGTQVGRKAVDCYRKYIKCSQ